MPTTLTHNDISDPVFFKVDPEGIHDCLNLLDVSSLHPSLAQGKKKFPINVKSFLLTGANELHSYKNMLNWLHKVAKDYPLPCSSFPSGLKRS